MPIYTFSEARQKLSSLLDQAANDGVVQIRRKDGQVFELRPQKSKKSPLDIRGVDMDLTSDEIVSFIHQGRKK